MGAAVGHGSARPVPSRYGRRAPLSHKSTMTADILKLSTKLVLIVNFDDILLNISENFASVSVTVWKLRPIEFDALYYSIDTF